MCFRAARRPTSSKTLKSLFSNWYLKPPKKGSYHANPAQAQASHYDSSNVRNSFLSVDSGRGASDTYETSNSSVTSGSSTTNHSNRWQQKFLCQIKLSRFEWGPGALGQICNIGKQRAGCFSVSFSCLICSVSFFLSGDQELSASANMQHWQTEARGDRD